MFDEIAPFVYFSFGKEVLRGFYMALEVFEVESQRKYFQKYCEKKRMYFSRFDQIIV